MAAPPAGAAGCAAAGTASHATGADSGAHGMAGTAAVTGDQPDATGDMTGNARGGPASGVPGNGCRGPTPGAVAAPSACCGRAGAPRNASGGAGRAAG